MRRLGTVDRISQGKLLVAIEGNDPPRIGANVVDEMLDSIGTVVDVIGPVDAPLAVVNPTEGSPSVDRLDKRVYLRDG